MLTASPSFTRAQRVHDRQEDRSRYGGTGTVFGRAEEYESAISWMRREIDSRLYQRCQSAWRLVERISARTDRSRATITMEVFIGDALVARGTASLFTSVVDDSQARLVDSIVEQVVALVEK